MKWMFTVLFLLTSVACAEEECECLGFYQRAKREGVPIYEEADPAARVVGKLALGEETCVVGQEREFSIVQVGTGGQKALRFVARSDLWGKKRPAEPSPFQTLREYLDYIRSGGVPDDALLPYRMLLEMFRPKSKNGGCPKKNERQ